MCVNGSYGSRMIEIAKYSDIPIVVIQGKETDKLNLDAVETALIENTDITNVAMVNQTLFLLKH